MVTLHGGGKLYFPYTTPGEILQDHPFRWASIVIKQVIVMSKKIRKKETFFTPFSKTYY